MKKVNVKELNSTDIIVDIIGWMITLTIIFYFLSMFLYMANDVKDAFEKCFYNTIIFFTALATLVGPIVLVWTLYNWKKQEKWKIRIDLVTSLTRDINRYNNLYARLAYSFLLQKAIIKEENENEINYDELNRIYKLEISEIEELKITIESNIKILENITDIQLQPVEDRMIFSEYERYKNIYGTYKLRRQSMGKFDYKIELSFFSAIYLDTAVVKTNLKVRNLTDNLLSIFLK